MRSAIADLMVCTRAARLPPSNVTSSFGRKRFKELTLKRTPYSAASWTKARHQGCSFMGVVGDDVRIVHIPQNGPRRKVRAPFQRRNVFTLLGEAKRTHVDPI